MKRILCALLLGLMLSVWHIAHRTWADKIVFACFPDGQAHSDLCTINPDGSDLRRLTKSQGSKHFPTWSPDKKQIVFRNSNKLWLMDAGGNNVIVLKKEYPFFKRPAWSPDGRTIAYGGGVRIFFLDIQTKKETSVWVPIEFDIRDIAWSPDGRKIAFTTKKAGQARDIYVVNIDGTDMRQLTHHRAEDRHPAWSPDGRKIVFVSHRNVVGGGIFLMNADGQNVNELTDTGETHPSWSPDGTQIACTVRFGNKGHIGVMDADGRNLKVVTEGNSPSWQSTFPGLAVHPNEKLSSTWGQIKYSNDKR